MSRWLVVAAICLSGSLMAGAAYAAPVSEATVEKACGDRIQGGCAGSQCATGCEKTEGGQLVSYGCTFPNKTGKTKATCNRTVLRSGQKNSGKNIVGKTPRVLKSN